MARPKAVIDAILAEKAEAALKDLPNCKVCLRLKAIVSCARYPISLVSSVFGTDRTTLWRWIKRFASKGVAGLMDEPKGHKPPKLGPEPRQQVAVWLEEGRNSQGEAIFWTFLDDLMDTLIATLINLTPSRFMELCQCSYLR